MRALLSRLGVVALTLCIGVGVARAGALRSNNLVYVSNQTGKLVEIDSSGAFVGTYNLSGTYGVLQDIDFDSAGNIYIVAGERVYVYDPGLTELREFALGSSNRKASQIGILNDVIYATGAENGGINKLGINGEWLGGAGFLGNITAIEIGPDGTIYGSDNNSDSFVLGTSAGQTGSYGGGEAYRPWYLDWTTTHGFHAVRQNYIYVYNKGGTLTTSHQFDDFVHIAGVCVHQGSLYLTGLSGDSGKLVISNLSLSESITVDLPTTQNYAVTAVPSPVPQQSTADVPSNGQAGQNTTVTVQARSAAGVLHPYGGSAVVVAVTGANTATASVTDNGDGTYTASYAPSKVGTDVVAVTMDGVAISGSPYISQVTVGPTSASQSTAAVPNGAAGSVTTITVQAKDAYGNNRTSGGDSVVVGVTGANTATPSVSDNGNGTYTANYAPTRSGTDSVAITIGGVAIGGSPYSSQVTAGPTSASHSTAVVPNGTAGSVTTITVQAKDEYANNRTSGGDSVVVSVTGANTATPSVSDNGNGSYTASYTPAQPGTDYVAITIGGAAVGGSPYASSVAVNTAWPHLSGVVRRYGNTALSGVTLTATPGGYSATSRSDGAYDLQVPIGWSGSLSASNSNVPRWSPASRSLTNVTSDKTGQDFMAQVRISGAVKTSSGAGVSGVTITLGNGGGTTTTGADGTWQIHVPWSWPGRITPSKSGYLFDPSSIVLTSCGEDRPGNDFTATPPVAVSGTVRRYGGGAVGGATVSASPGGYSAITGSDGSYALQVALGWSGTVTPSKTGVPRWSPANLRLTNVTSAKTGQDFMAQVRISGAVKTSSGAGVSGVTITLGNGGGTTTTGSNGTWQMDVPWSWRGRVTAKKTGYDMSPASQVLSDCCEDKAGIDFVAAPRRSITGTVRRYGNTPLANVVLTASRGGYRATTASDGTYSLQVPDGWTGEITASFSNVPRWEPAVRSFTNATSAKTGQDFMAQVRLSGAVKTSSGAGVSGVTITLGNVGGTTTTGSNGTWQMDVPWAWRGRVTAKKTGYDIVPASQVLGDCTEDKTGIDFVAAPRRSIQGTVRRYRDVPLANVELRASPGGYRATTASDGTFSLQVPNGWSGTVTPSSPNVPHWAPEARTFSALTADRTGQDYLAQVRISGAVLSSSGQGVAGVTITLGNGGGSTTTAPDGTWGLLVPWTWAGRITPTKAGYRFTPTSRVLTSCSTDQPGQHFTCSESRMRLLLPTGGEVTLVFLGGSPVGGETSRAPDGNGNSWSWSFAVAPEAETRGGGELTVFWPGARDVPAGLSLVLHDLGNGRSTFLRWSASYLCHLAPGERARAFRVTMVRETAGLALQNVRPLPTRDGCLAVGFTLTRSAEVSLAVSGLNGRRIGQVAGQMRTAGANELAWAARDEQGRPLPNGVYRVEVVATDDTGRQVRALVLVTVR